MNEENLNQNTAPEQVESPAPSQTPDVNYYNSGKNNRGLTIALLVACPIILILAVVGVIVSVSGKNPLSPTGPNNPGEITTENSGEFAFDFLRRAYANSGSGRSNMIVSPYSMEAAWQTAAAGAEGDTKAEIESVFGSRTMPEFAQLSNANALFVRDKYAKYLKKDFTTSFEGDLRLDPFNSPEPFNTWVSENTNGMIDKILDEAPDEDVIMLIMNAIAMDEKWADEFKCQRTEEKEFTLWDNSKMKTPMMNGAAERYFETNSATGIVREYAKRDDGSAFEFVGIMPKNGVLSYLDTLSSSEIEAMTASEIANNSENSDGSINKVTLSLPRFEYISDLNDGRAILESMGITQAFDKDDANFGALMDLNRMDENLYISDVLQRAYIKMNESGTKAAAVTALPVSGATSVGDMPKYVYYHVDFDKPFVYLIRDKETKEIIFEGVVEKPNEWLDESCGDSD